MYKAKFFLAVTALSVFLHLSSTAQVAEKFLAGTVEFLNGETKDGFIKNDEMATMNFKIYYKGSKTEKKPVFYTASVIKRVRLSNGEVYEKFRFKPFNRNDSIVVLAKLLVQGKVSLYELDYKDDHIFLARGNENLFVLQNDKLELNSREVERYYFRTHLHSVMPDIEAVTKKIEKISFSNKELISIVSEYNIAANGQNTVITVKSNSVRFIIFDIAGMSKSKYNNEVALQLIYRIYFPKISKSTSINAGLSYFITNYTVQDISGKEIKNRIQLVSMPFQIQQNLLNKRVRPFLFTGFNFSYVKTTNPDILFYNGKGLQKNYGLGILYGAGIEADVAAGLRVKCEYRFENYRHLINAGIGYTFSLSKAAK